MAINSVNGMGMNPNVYTNYGKKTTNQSNFADELQKAAQTSVVEQYMQKHPEDRYVVTSQLKAGEATKQKYGANVSTKDMTMDEYKQYIMGIINRIPFDSSRPNDTQIINISQAGWEQMKNDTEYETWVLGYLTQDRAVRNPFASMGVSGFFAVENFGASIEEHHGESMAKTSRADSSNADDEESWWEKRHKKFEEMMETHIKETQEKAKSQRQFAWEMYLNSLNSANISAYQPYRYIDGRDEAWITTSNSIIENM